MQTGAPSRNRVTCCKERKSYEDENVRDMFSGPQSGASPPFFLQAFYLSRVRFYRLVFPFVLAFASVAWAGSWFCCGTLLTFLSIRVSISNFYVLCGTHNCMSLSMCVCLATADTHAFSLLSFTRNPWTECWLLIYGVETSKTNIYIYIFAYLGNDRCGWIRVRFRSENLRKGYHI